jgi:capsular polysaccharide biosynthesis protein
MELVLFWRVIRRRWYLILLPIIIVGVVVAPDFFDNGPAVSGGFTTTVRYTAAQELDALPNRDGDFQDVWLAAELTVDAFTEWVRTNKFAEEVAQVTARNGLEINPAALSIAADNARSIGQIFINWGDEAQLAVIANAVIEVLSERNQAYFPQLGDAPAQVRLLDEPVITPAPPPLADRYAPLVRMAFAVVVGVGIAFAVEYLDPRLHRREDLESMGFKVIATIPRK